MNQYTVDLFCRRNRWNFEVTVEAASLQEAEAIARRDYSDKDTRVVRVTRN